MGWIHAVIDVAAGQHARQAAFWAAALDWQLGAPWPGHPGLASFTPPRGTPYLHLQEIDGPPLVHIDIESDDPDGCVATASALGAELGQESDRWQTLRSPGGLPFCVVAVT